MLFKDSNYEMLGPTNNLEDIVRKLVLRLSPGDRNVKIRVCLGYGLQKLESTISVDGKTWPVVFDLPELNFPTWSVTISSESGFPE